MDFFQIVREQPFMQNALLAGLLGALACGIVGSYVVVRRIVFISGGIAHSVIGGMGMAYYFGYEPFSGALAAAVIAAIILGLVNMYAHQHEDTLIGALWAIGMAVGLLFMAAAPYDPNRPNSYSVDLMSFLLGDILLVTRGDLLLIFILDLLILALVLLNYRQFLAVCFDEEYARLQGLRVEWLYLLLLCLIAITVVILIRVVGLILVIALLSLPAATSLQFVGSLGRAMIAATLLSLAFTTAGLFFSTNSNLLAGPTIILIAGVVYLLSLLVRFLRRRPRSGP